MYKFSPITKTPRPIKIRIKPKIPQKTFLDVIAIYHDLKNGSRSRVRVLYSYILWQYASHTECVCVFVCARKMHLMKL